MISPWSATDDAVLAHASKYASPMAEAAFSGVWSTVGFQPDLFSPQKYVVGVVVANLHGVFVFRLISDTTKLECIYGRKFASQFDQFLKSAEYTLSRMARERVLITELDFETDNLQLSPLWATSGISQEAVLSRLFNDVVPLEPSEESVGPEFVSMDNEQVRRLVGVELKRIAGLSYERIVVDARDTVVRDDATGTTHKLDFNLRIRDGVGSVVSAIYKTPFYVELGLLRADRDLRTYAGIRKLRNIAVFVMAPRHEQFGPVEFTRMSELLDETTWRLEQGGLRVATFEDPGPLARGILEWAGVEPVVPPDA